VGTVTGDAQGPLRDVPVHAPVRAGAGMADHIVVGKIGRVTSLVSPTQLGEVVIPVRGGTEAFLARPAVGETLPDGTAVVVTDLLPPRMVEVTALHTPTESER
jgi:hypothetical protein